MKQLVLVLGTLLLASSISLAQENCNENPPDGLSVQGAYSIFVQNYQNGDYEFALKFGRWIPCAKLEKIDGISSYKLENQYNRLINIYEEVGRSKENPSERAAYIDTALTLSNERLALFGKTDQSRFDIIFKRGRFFQQNYDYIDDGLKKAYADYEELFNIDAEKATNLGNGYYLRVVLDNMIRDDRTEAAQSLIDEVKPVASGDLAEYIEEKQQDLLGSPEEQIAYFKPIVESEPGNVNAWKALRDAYRQLNDRQALREALIKVHDLEESYESALAVAEMEKSNANYARAAEYFQKALDLSTKSDQRKQMYMELADAHINLEELERAKRFVQSSIKIDPNDGRAYIKMATIYGQAVNQCTANRKLEAQDKVVYWAVIDYLNKAKQVDSSVANSVNRQLPQYQEYTPNSEDKFFTLNLENGQKVTINGNLMPCYSWINETVTVR